MTNRSEPNQSHEYRLRDAVALAALVALGVVVPVAFGVASGAAFIPRNDDWVYRRIALEFAGTGVLALHSVTTMMVGLIVGVQPILRALGDTTVAFAVAGWSSALAVVIAAYGLARVFLPPRRAALAASLTIVFPGYLAYATSFMTDAPAVAAQFICLGLGANAVRARPVRTGQLTAALVAGFVGFSIREFAIAAPMAVAGSALWADRRQWSTWTLSALFGIGCVALYALKLTLPGQAVSGGVGTGAITNMFPALTSISLVALPAALLAARHSFRTWPRFDIALGAEIGLIVAAADVMLSSEANAPAALLDNLTSQFGVPSSWYLIGGRPLVLGNTAWLLFNAVAVVSAVITSTVAFCIATAYIRRCRRSGRTLSSIIGQPHGVIALFILAVLAGLTAYSVRFAVFDRYLWSLLPPLAILLLAQSHLPERRVSAGRMLDVVASLSLLSWCALLGVSVMFMLNSYAFDAARWQGGDRLVNAGIPGAAIDAGYEWVGEHQPELPPPNPPPGGETFYEHWWPERVKCAVVAGSPPPKNLPTVGLVRWSLFLVTGPPETLYLYRAAAGCAA